MPRFQVAITTQKASGRKDTFVQSVLAPDQVKAVEVATAKLREKWIDRIVATKTQEVKR